MRESLDVIRLMRQGRVQRTLMNLILTKRERELARFQYKESVIPFNKLASRADKTSSEDELSKVCELTLLQRLIKKQARR